MSFLFCKKKSLRDQIGDWERLLRLEIRAIERDINNMEWDEKESIQDAKQYVRKKRMDMVRLTAKNILQKRASIKNLYHAKIQLDTIINKLKLQLTRHRIVESFQWNVVITRQFNAICQSRNLSETLKTVKQEMDRANVFQDLVNDNIDSSFGEMLESQDLDEATDALVKELTAEDMNSLTVTSAPLPPMPSTMNTGNSRLDEQLKQFLEEEEMRMKKTEI